MQQYQNKTAVKTLCRWAMLPRSHYYYRAKTGRKGFAPSSITLTQSGRLVANEQVVDDIKTILSSEFVCYGYRKVAVELKNQGYFINHKKVYRLMKEHHLLLGKIIRTSGKRQWVKHRKITAVKPMEYLCLDIKYLWVAAEQRFYYLLTIIDVYTRKVLEWLLQRSIKKADVINLFRKVQRQYGIKGVYIRNDNGSQFIANDVRQFLRQAEAHQEFTHVATPEENSYIEAYHSILQREVVERFELESYYDAKITIASYVDFYNNRRIHSGIGFKKPQQVWDEYVAQNPNFTPSAEAEAGNAGGQPARNMLTNGDIPEGADNTAPSNSFSIISLFLDASKNSSQAVLTDLNSWDNSVQLIGG
jgi:putative transposase